MKKFLSKVKKLRFCNQNALKIIVFEGKIAFLERIIWKNFRLRRADDLGNRSEVLIIQSII